MLFLWIPSYIGILGNKIADQAAKLAVSNQSSLNCTKESTLEQIL